MAAAKTLLIVDDDPSLTEPLRLDLEDAGYEVEVVHYAPEALKPALRREPELVILNVETPCTNERLEVCEGIRRTTEVPILVVASRRSEADELRVFRRGADAYMTKPFAISLLLARVEALLRRSAPRSAPSTPKQTVVTVGDLRIDMGRYEASLAGEHLELSPTEFRFLATLASQPGRVVPHDELLSQVWGPEYLQGDVHRKYLKLYVWYLRRKIEKDLRRPRCIMTKRGVGYFLSDSSLMSGRLGPRPLPSVV